MGANEGTGANESASFTDVEGNDEKGLSHGSDAAGYARAQRELEVLTQQLQENAIELEAQTDALDLANAELRASEARARDVFEQAPLAVAVMTGAEHIYTIASARYTAMLGGRPMLGLPVRDAFPELNGSGIFEILDDVYTTGRPFSATERRIPLIDPADGVLHDRFFDLHYQPLRDGRGKIYGVASSSVDVTEQVFARQIIEQTRAEAEQARAEAEIARIDAEQSAAQAMAANQAKSAFLATMSHELRTPINAIQGYTQLIGMGLGGMVTDAQRDYLHRLGASAQHLLGVVNDILDLSKVDAGEMTVTQEIAGAGEAVSAALDLTRPQAATRGVRLVNTLPDAWNHEPGSAESAENEASIGPPIQYVGDPHRVRQVLLNLLSNAVKFTDAGGTVTVTAGTTANTPASADLHGRGPWAWFRVADTGIGIAPKQHAAVFEPFHQVQHGHTRTQGGTGLGLAISRRLARLMGGDITLESKPGTGSTFTLWLPAAHVADTTSATDAALAETAIARGARAQRDNPLAMRGLRELGEYLRTHIEPIIDTYVDRLRAAPEIPLARTTRRPELEDHVVSFMADLAQALVILDGSGSSAAALLSDSSLIQRAVSEAHGARRYAQGWTIEALQCDYAILRTVIIETVGADTLDDRKNARAAPYSVRADASLATATQQDHALTVLLGMIDRAADSAQRAWRRNALEDTNRVTR